MKKKTYWIGLTALILAICGTVFKTLHYPGASMLMTLGFAILVLVFFPIALLDSFRNESKRLSPSFYIVTYITLLIVFTGMLFKIMHWPGAGKILIVAILIPYVLFLPVFLVSTAKVANYSIFNIVSVLLLLAFTSVFNVLLALGVSKDRLDDSMYLASLYQRSTVMANREHLKPVDGGAEIMESSDKVLSLIREAKEGILTLSDGSSDLLGSDPRAIDQPDSKSIATQVLFRGQEPYLGFKLEESISEFINVVEKTNDPYLTAERAKEILYFKTFENDDRRWSVLMFTDSWTSWSLVYLGMLENNIILLRDELLQTQ